MKDLGEDQFICGETCKLKVKHAKVHHLLMEPTLGLLPCVTVSDSLKLVILKCRIYTVVKEMLGVLPGEG